MLQFIICNQEGLWWKVESDQWSDLTKEINKSIIITENHKDYLQKKCSEILIWSVTRILNIFELEKHINAKTVDWIPLWLISKYGLKWLVSCDQSSDLFFDVLSVRGSKEICDFNKVNIEIMDAWKRALSDWNLRILDVWITTDYQPYPFITHQDKTFNLWYKNWFKILILFLNNQFQKVVMLQVEWDVGRRMIRENILAIFSLE